MVLAQDSWVHMADLAKYALYMHRLIPYEGHVLRCPESHPTERCRACALQAVTLRRSL